MTLSRFDFSSTSKILNLSLLRFNEWSGFENLAYFQGMGFASIFYTSTLHYSLTVLYLRIFINSTFPEKPFRKSGKTLLFYH